MPYPRPRQAGWKALFFVGCIVFAEPLTSTLLFPFVYFMVRDFTEDHALIGFRVGLITSSFFLCQLITTPLWGWFSDRFGRKLCFIIGLLGGAISIAGFGLSRSLLWAVLSRSISGLLNGNIGVARTAVAEIASKYGIKQNQAFSIFGFCGAFGYIAGPLVGGLLSKPAESYGWRGPYDAFVTFPYLLPCAVSCTFNLAIMIAAAYGLEETKQENSHSEVAAPSLEEEALLLPHTLPPDTATSKSAPTWRLPKEVVVLMIGTSLISLHTIMFEEVYALFAASSLADGTGLSFQPRDIAVSLSVLGPAVFFTQLFGYPLLNARFDTIVLWKISAVSFAIDYPLASVLPLIQSDGLRETALLMILCIRVTSVVIGWTSLNILTNQVVDPNRRGFITAIVQASASLSRAIGPTVGGTLWSWSENNNLPPPFDFHLFFVSISALAVLQGLTGYWIPRSAASTN